MVCIASWTAYQSAEEALYEKAPDLTRYCVKWRPSEGKLVLKITDDTTCLKYKTHSSIYLNRFEALNVSLLQKMQNVRGFKQEGGTPPRKDAPVPVPTAAPGSMGVAGSGNKKKGKNKK